MRPAASTSTASRACGTSTSGTAGGELADAAQRQMATLAFHSAYAGGTNEPAIALAERLSELVYPSINTFFFTSGGAEATETSFKTARFYWKALGKPDKIKVISRHRAYHGLTLAAMSATGLPAFWPMFEPRTPGFLHIDAPDPYRFVNPTIRRSASAWPRPTSSRRRSCARAPTRWRRSSPSPCRAPAASSSRRPTTSGASARSARDTTCC